MIRVKALEAITYAAVDYKVGEEFDTVEDMHATILSHAQKVVVVEQAEAPHGRRRRNEYDRRDMRSRR